MSDKTPEGYKTLITDIDGVIFFDRFFEYLSDILGVDEEKLRETIKKPSQMRTYLNQGAISEAEYWNYISTVLEVDSKLLTASNLRDIYVEGITLNEEYVELLKELRRDKVDKVIALSNSYPHREPVYYEKGLHKFLDGLALSHRIGHMKPSEEAFETTNILFLINPSRSVIVDDTKSIIDVVTQKGPYKGAVLYKGNESDREVIKALN